MNFGCRHVMLMIVLIAILCIIYLKFETYGCNLNLELGRGILKKLDLTKYMESTSIKNISVNHPANATTYTTGANTESTHNAEMCSSMQPYNLTLLAEQQHLIYNMVPKCGSLGIRTLIQNLSLSLNYTAKEGSYRFKNEPSIYHYAHATLPEIVDDNNKLKPMGRNILYRHYHFIDYRLIGQDTPYHINVIRDPVDRLISSYYFLRQDYDLDNPNPYIPYNMSFDECVETNHWECNYRVETFSILPFFCGHEWFCLRPSPNCLALAKHNVERYFPVVGYTENLGGFFELCEVIWPQFFTGAKQVFGNSFERHTTDNRVEPKDSTKLKMADKMSLEYDFYKWIKQRFDWMYSTYVRTR